MHCSCFIKFVKQIKKNKINFELEINLILTNQKFIKTQEWIVLEKLGKYYIKV